jgi:hypothetical protein
MHKLLNDAAARAIRYLDGLDARSVVPTPEAIADLKEQKGLSTYRIHMLVLGAQETSVA